MPAKALHYLFERTVGEETKVERARRRRLRFDAGVEALRMDIKFLLAEAQCNATVAIVFEFHAQGMRIKRYALVDFARREDDVVDTFDHDAA